MVSKMTKDIVSVFRDLAKYPELTSATFSNQSTTDTLIVNTRWSQRDIEKGEKTSFSKTYILSPDGSSGLQVVSETVPQEFSNILWDRESPSGKLRAVVLQAKNKKGEDKQYLEIWNSSRKVKTFDVQSSEKHGKVYNSDVQFGCLEWSPSERYLVYIAEEKIPKTTSFFKEDKKSDEENAKEEAIQGDEHLYREDWGEMLVDKHHSVPCVIDIQTGEITVLDNIPSDVSAGQACWAADDAGVVFVGRCHEPYRLGVHGCLQRRSGVYFVDLANSKCELLSEENRAVRSPKFTPDKSQLLYLDIMASRAHHQSARLLMYDWDKKTTTVVVDVVNAAKGGEFAGLYNIELPHRGWLHGGKELLVDTHYRSKQVPTIINLETKSVQQLDTGSHEATSWVLDVWNDYVILQASAPNQMNHLMVGKIEDGETKWLLLESEETKVSGVSYKVIEHQVTPDRVNPKYPDLDYDSVLCLPTPPESPPDYKPPPLIIVPHGGPHTTSDVEFDLFTAGFCQCGYAVLLVNYRGSAGFGQNSIDSLLGNIGDQDVQDVWAAAISVMESGVVDAENVFVFGLSHGGFLTAHLIGQYPGQFKAAACQNPVIDLTSMIGATDCVDWAFEECGQKFDYNSLVNPDILAEMWKRSPLSHVDKVTTPLLLMMGKDDLRVPTKQACLYYRSLKARNKAVRFLAYENNSHLITTVPAESDCFVNIMKWFGDHMQ